MAINLGAWFYHIINCVLSDDLCIFYNFFTCVIQVRKYLASKSQPLYSKDNWPEMNAMELDMRLKLADLQRQYKEKQRELSKLKPKRKSSDEREDKRHKSRKKSTHSDRSITPPPLLDKMDVPVKPHRNELLKPPTLCAVGECELSNLPRLEPVKSIEPEKCYKKPLQKSFSVPVENGTISDIFNNFYDFHTKPIELTEKFFFIRDKNLCILLISSKSLHN